ncbi:MAG: hypothetical protein A2651_01680 [Candidatus Yanofskybacteria bacterium RIFCSPHIGHO2_01_FULL_42_12]|uniref:ASCH domain-containing protein n=1 Tax=Candidatus Yanofskybacteria bacterium RIFCSPLOWO2_01_FULL_42_49 TaxID=1802694 RepID=A0A1F8GCP9_9BACT|nr:MAG: hypothetical protein A2651_01680 [Candidatus Yanofskybacteria bacterium RIFCSPHIGHO2_01_FULL_42_12]OGN23137.1 MAG: hypothetical protein A2918_03810 [Candidatus Yanofskybacteria bacterium RIFCSPLOWO2_01_FULL_42_49]
MNRYILRFNTTNKNSRSNFLDIKSGKKKIETRAATTKYRDIKKGSLLVFVCGKEKFEKTVKKAKIFKTISSMVKVYPPNKIMPDISSVRELRKAYFSYPRYKEKIKKFGLVALEL